MKLDWYNTLNKSPLTPPSWVFGPAWTVLYVMIGLSFFFILREGNLSSKIPQISVFVFQLTLNLMWSKLFFGMHLIKASLVDIIVLWISIILTIILFWQISHTAAFLLIPYLLWVSFASYLNYQIFRLN